MKNTFQRFQFFFIFISSGRWKGKSLEGGDKTILVVEKRLSPTVSNKAATKLNMKKENMIQPMDRIA